MSSCHYRVPPENPVDQYSGHDSDRRQRLRTFEPNRAAIPIIAPMLPQSVTARPTR